MGELVLINGRFLKDGKEVPLEIGNREQIDCYKKYIKEVGNKTYNKIEVNYSVDIDYTYTIRCHCGNYISADDTLYDVDLDFHPNVKERIEDEIASSYKVLKCRECGTEYVIDYDDEYGELVAIDDNVNKCNFNPKYDNITDEILNKGKDNDDN